MMAVIVHEVSHGWVALRLGDTTSLDAGRLTLNPLRHIDPVGTILLPFLLLLVKSPFLFGWAKPVPINVLNLRHPRQDMLWVGIAGPVANFTLAAAVAFLLKILGPGTPPLLTALANYLILVNLVLGTFNLIPIPPLDGSRVLTALLPSRFARWLYRMERWGIVLVDLLLTFGLIHRFLWPVVEFLARLLGV